MASLRKRGATYFIRWTDFNGEKREKSAGRDKRVAEQALHRIEEELDRQRMGLVSPKDLAARDHESRSLAEHLADWHRDIQARGKTLRHADQYLERAGKLAALCRGTSLPDLEPGRKAEALKVAEARLEGVLKLARLSDLTPERIQSALAILIESGKSPQTANHYRAAMRAFVRWAADKERITTNPMRGVGGYNVEEDIRHERRSLTDDELALLIRTAEAGPELFGMPGPLRAMAYRVAAATGFRVEELRSLTPESFRLAGPAPTIHLRASGTKNRRPANQPIPLTLAHELRGWLPGQPKRRSVFPLHHETAKAIRRDLEAARIPYETDAGVADFHSLRAYYVSAMVRSGANVKTVQTLARHAKPETTLKHYAKVNESELRGAVESIPCPTATQGQGGRARVALFPQDISTRLPHFLPTSGDGERRTESHAGEGGEMGTQPAPNDKTPEPMPSDGFRRSESHTVVLLTERGGFEPPKGCDTLNGLANRRFRPLSHLSLAILL